jgi:large subunit ribosomal protein L27
MAHKNGRDSVGHRLGVKAGDGQLVTAGSIIVRQRGMTFLAGEGADLGRDYTLFATTDGRVRFEHVRRDKKRVRIEAEAAPSGSSQTQATAGSSNA